MKFSDKQVSEFIELLDIYHEMKKAYHSKDIIEYNNFKNKIDILLSRSDDYFDMNVDFCNTINIQGNRLTFCFGSIDSWRDVEFFNSTCFDLNKVEYGFKSYLNESDLKYLCAASFLNVYC